MIRSRGREGGTTARANSSFTLELLIFDADLVRSATVAARRFAVSVLGTSVCQHVRWLGERESGRAAAHWSAETSPPDMTANQVQDHVTIQPPARIGETRQALRCLPSPRSRGEM